MWITCLGLATVIILAVLVLNKQHKWCKNEPFSGPGAFTGPWVMYRQTPEPGMRVIESGAITIDNSNGQGSGVMWGQPTKFTLGENTIDFHMGKKIPFHWMGSEIVFQSGDRNMVITSWERYKMNHNLPSNCKL